VRDVTFAENASQVRTGTGPHIMACLSTLAIGVLSRAGPSTSPLPSATTLATLPDPSPPSGSPSRIRSGHPASGEQVVRRRAVNPSLRQHWRRPGIVSAGERELLVQARVCPLLKIGWSAPSI
jgi:hypothetical protein